MNVHAQKKVRTKNIKLKMDSYNKKGHGIPKNIPYGVRDRIIQQRCSVDTSVLPESCLPFLRRYEVAWALAERSLEDYATLHGLRRIVWLVSRHTWTQLMAFKWRVRES